MPRHIVVPLIIACAMFMQTLDSTILATSIPPIALALHEPPLRLHLAITAYTLSLAAFLPLGGWLADRFGARRVFRSAILIFTLASAMCGFAGDINTLLLARTLQGIGGAMMVPVGRLILVRSVEKSELIKALTLMSMPALVGPIIGPPLGGLITTLASWRWIFWVNLPIGLLGFVLVGAFIAEVKAEKIRPFDLRGFLLSGLGLSATLFGADTAVTRTMETWISLPILASGLVLLGLYVVHARRVEHPILDLKVLRVPTLRASIVGGTLFRIGIGAIPFLLPLLLQEGFGYTPLQSGLVTFASSAGAFGIRGFTSRVLKRFGMRNTLTCDVVIAGLFMASYSLFRPSTPAIVMVALLACGGIFRAIGFSSITALAFADVTSAETSQATSLTFMAQRLSMTTAVGLSAFILGVVQGSAPTIPIAAFDTAFTTIALISSLSALVFARLSADAGASLTGRQHGVAAAVPVPVRVSEG